MDKKFIQKNRAGSLPENEKCTLEWLGQFCTEFSPGLESPFADQGYIVASDGKVLVAVQYDERFGDVRPRPAELWEIPFSPVYPGEWHEMPEIDQPAKVMCGLCNGSGKVYECPECEGEGFLAVSNGFNTYDVSCKACNEEGYVSVAIRPEMRALTCHRCEGSGQVLESRKRSQKVYGRILSMEVLQ